MYRERDYRALGGRVRDVHRVPVPIVFQEPHVVVPLDVLGLAADTAEPPPTPEPELASYCDPFLDLVQIPAFHYIATEEATSNTAITVSLGYTGLTDALVVLHEYARSIHLFQYPTQKMPYLSAIDRSDITNRSAPNGLEQPLHPCS